MEGKPTLFPHFESKGKKGWWEVELTAKKFICMMVDLWNFGFLFLSVCINTVTYLVSEVSYVCRHIYLLRLSECFAKPQRM